MKLSKLSNQTNSQDPQAVNSRVFVGNLNTFQCSKTDVERMFQRYGRLAGISMHKGYAFVQFTTPFDARNACHGEDGRSVLSQVLDVNLVAEPKPHQVGRERQNVSKTGNDWDYYYDSYCTSTLFPVTTPSSRPVKRQRLIAPLQRPTFITSNQLVQQQQIMANGLLSLQHHKQQHQQISATSPSRNFCNSMTNRTLSSNLSDSVNNTNCDSNDGAMQVRNLNGQHVVGPFKAYSNPDILICGNCREFFSDLNEFMSHKKVYCKLRFTCKCQDQLPNKVTFPSSKLLCVMCKVSFSNPWDLMVHAQAAHMVNIYEIGDSDEDEDSSCNKSEKSDKSDESSKSDNFQPNKSPKNNGTDSNSIIMPESSSQITVNFRSVPTGTNPTTPSLSNEMEISSSRSNSPSDIETGSSARDCIVHALTMDAINTTEPSMTAFTLSITNGTMATHG